MKQKQTKEYLGTLISSHNYKEVLESEGKDQISYHKKHLKAYIRGFSTFFHGFNYNKDGDKISRKEHMVQQKIT